VRETKIQRTRRQAFERKVFVSVLRAAGNEVMAEYRFDQVRRWRFDLLINGEGISAHPIAIEIEGLNGRHQSMKGFLADMEKYNAATIAGYRLLRFTTRQIGDGTALDVLARAGVRVTADWGGTYPAEGS